MTDPKSTGARVSITPAGLMFLAITSVGWGFNWPVTKYLLSELPPLLTLRGATGVVGAALLAGLALPRGQSLGRPPQNVAKAGDGRRAQCRLLDDADGAGAAVAAGRRGRADRLHHADLGFDPGVADPLASGRTCCA